VKKVTFVGFREVIPPIAPLGFATKPASKLFKQVSGWMLLYVRRVLECSQG